MDDWLQYVLEPTISTRGFLPPSPCAKARKAKAKSYTILSENRIVSNERRLRASSLWPNLCL